MADRIPRYLFDRRDYRLLSIVNRVFGGWRTDSHAHAELYALFHPEGIKELAESRGLRIAYAAVLLVSSLTSGRVADRLGALQALRDEVIDTAAGPMPRNTARVLLQVMKELVRAHGNQRRQLELAHDFRAAASGKPRIIRRQLRRFHLLEMPESWNQVAFDDHVHDANTKGRKSPTHLIMDAWIKGIRRLRVIYYNSISPKSAVELIQAAEIMGITLRIGIEFAARLGDKYAQLIWVLRGFADHQAFLCFLTESETAALMEAGKQVSDYQQAYVLAVLQAFNQCHRKAMKDQYGVCPAELDEADFMAFVAPGQASLLHLAKYIHAKTVPLLPKILADLRQAYQAASHDAERHLIEERVARLNALNPETILEKYLDPTCNPSIPDPTVPQDDASVPELLKLKPWQMVNRLVPLHSGYRITLNLTNLQVDDVLELLYTCEGKITRLEIFNLKDYAAGITEHIAPILELQKAINQKNIIALKRIIRSLIHRLESESKVQPDRHDQGRLEQLKTILHDIASLTAFYSGRHLKARIGSDSTGGSSRSHGMGLVVDETLPRRAQREIRRSAPSRLRLPISILVAPQIIYRKPDISNVLTRLSALLRRLPGCSKVGLRHQSEWLALEYITRLMPNGNIVTLGGISEPSDNCLSLTPQKNRQRGRVRHWACLNSLTKNILKVLIGFIPAFVTFSLTKDWWLLAYGGAFIWFGITGLRNIVQSVLGGGGWRRSPLLRWNDLISWERITDSLLYTGFSVPLLDYVAKTVILDRGLGITTATHPFWLYSLMALTNGVYLFSHNIFRGLPKGAAVVNIFRSILSIPLAVGLNAGIGLLLSALGVGPVAPILQKWAAVISKASSDVVAGIIEGAADRFQNIDRRRRALRHKFSQILDTYSELEMLLPEAGVMEFLLSPESSKRSIPADARDLAKGIYIHALDLLYFWMYQPRSRLAMRNLLKSMSPDESRIILRAQAVLQHQRAISLLFIEGVLGQGFSKPLAFYLSQSGPYLEAVQKMMSALAIEPSDHRASIPLETRVPDDSPLPAAKPSRNEMVCKQRKTSAR